MKMSRLKIIILSFCICKVFPALKLDHSYYSLETAEDIDQTRSLLQLNKCKTECLQMKDYFPFQFRYHRLIIRQTDGMVKYFVGHCQVKMLQDSFEEWSKLKGYIDSTNLFGDSDILNKGEGKIWESYNDACQDKKLMLTQTIMKSMKLTRNHSNFYYYDDGNFENVEPFNDLGELFAKVNGRI